MPKTFRPSRVGDPLASALPGGLSLVLAQRGELLPEVQTWLYSWLRDTVRLGSGATPPTQREHVAPPALGLGGSPIRGELPAEPFAFTTVDPEASCLQ
jgi:hypothetical protein